MKEKENKISLEFIIHPGETLKEILENINMSPEELAKETGISLKHIRGIVNGKTEISVKLAEILEKVLGISAVFWINLQEKYNKEIIEYK